MTRFTRVGLVLAVVVAGVAALIGREALNAGDWWWLYYAALSAWCFRSAYGIAVDAVRDSVNEAEHRLKMKQYGRVSQ